MAIGMLLTIGHGSTALSQSSLDTRLRGSSKGACPYFTRPSVESDGEVLRLNSHAAGSRVCYRRRMYSCSAGAWSDMGDCPSFRGWEKMTVERLEGSSGNQPPDGAGRGRGAAAGPSLEDLMMQNERNNDLAAAGERRTLMGEAQQAMQESGNAREDFGSAATSAQPRPATSSWNDFNAQFNAQARALAERKAREGQAAERRRSGSGSTVSQGAGAPCLGRARADGSIYYPC